MFNWLTDFFRNRRVSLRPRAPHIERVAAHNSHFLNPPLDIHSARVYAGSPWVYVAINRIAEAGALVPLKVYRLENEKRIGIENHPLELPAQQAQSADQPLRTLRADDRLARAAWQRLLVPRWRWPRAAARDLAAAPRPRDHRASRAAHRRRLPLRDQRRAHPPRRHRSCPLPPLASR